MHHPCSSRPAAALTLTTDAQVTQDDGFKMLKYGSRTYVGLKKENGAGGVFGKGFCDAVAPGIPDGTSVVESALEGRALLQLAHTNHV